MRPYATLIDTLALEAESAPGHRLPEDRLALIEEMIASVCETEEQRQALLRLLAGSLKVASVSIHPAIHRSHRRKQPAALHHMGALLPGMGKPRAAPAKAALDITVSSFEPLADGTKHCIRESLGAFLGRRPDKLVALLTSLRQMFHIREQGSVRIRRRLEEHINLLVRLMDRMGIDDTHALLRQAGMTRRQLGDFNRLIAQGHTPTFAEQQRVETLRLGLETLAEQQVIALPKKGTSGGSEGENDAAQGKILEHQPQESTLIAQQAKIVTETIHKNVEQDQNRFKMLDYLSDMEKLARSHAKPLQEVRPATGKPSKNPSPPPTAASRRTDTPRNIDARTVEQLGRNILSGMSQATGPRVEPGLDLRGLRQRRTETERQQRTPRETPRPEDPEKPRSGPDKGRQ